MRYKIPFAVSGQRVGLLGGSFDPAHAGHVALTHAAFQRFGLDQIWWLVTPGNPLKSKGPADLAARMAQAQNIMHHPRVHITHLETALGTRYTADSLRAIGHLYPRVAFTWVMGADNLANFHHWHDWTWIMQNMPIGVLARPGLRTAALWSKAAQIYRPYRVAGHALAHQQAPAWAFENFPMRADSSTAIRATGGWQT
ncbi:MAG: nicotinate-nucleotide adenylyltransferase [Pseudomonadota bacterium]